VLTENLRRDLAAFVAEVEAWADELDSYEALDPEGRVEIVRDAAAFRVMLQRVATDCPLEWDEKCPLGVDEKTCWEAQSDGEVDYVACWRALCRNLAAERETAEREGMARDD
jgi:hypothetical protein